MSDDIEREPVVGQDPPPTPAGAAMVFRDRLDVAERYVALLADTGISHGLVGPREAPRLWDRHVLNCAVVHPAFTEGAAVADIGSGAGLPGLVLAIVRPDLDLHLIEPLQRRCVWLERTIAELELDNVVVREARAESMWGVQRFPHVTARAVARIGELGRWCLPLLARGGTLHALKGSRAAEELESDREPLTALGATRFSIETFGEGVVDPPTTVLSVGVDAPVDGRRVSNRARKKSATSARARRKGPSRS